MGYPSLGTIIIAYGKGYRNWGGQKLTASFALSLERGISHVRETATCIVMLSFFVHYSYVKFCANAANTDFIVGILESSVLMLRVRYMRVHYVR